jgi:hypothetical protein
LFVRARSRLDEWDAPRDMKAFRLPLLKSTITCGREWSGCSLPGFIDHATEYFVTQPRGSWRKVARHVAECDFEWANTWSYASTLRPDSRPRRVGAKHWIRCNQGLRAHRLLEAMMPTLIVDPSVGGTSQATPIGQQFRLDFAFIGNGASGGDPSDTLTPAARANAGQVRWIDHTYSHPDLDTAERNQDEQQSWHRNHLRRWCSGRELRRVHAGSGRR